MDNEAFVWSCESDIPYSELSQKNREKWEKTCERYCRGLIAYGEIEIIRNEIEDDHDQAVLLDYEKQDN